MQASHFTGHSWAPSIIILEKNAYIHQGFYSFETSMCFQLTVPDNMPQ